MPFATPVNAFVPLAYHRKGDGGAGTDGESLIRSPITVIMAKASSTYLALRIDDLFAAAGASCQEH